MTTATDDFCALLVRSRLLSAEEVQALAEGWLAEAGNLASDCEALARWLVGRQLLTNYQASLLLRGYADHFFLDQYKLLERLGTGRMAGVFKAVHRLGQTVAIKILPPSKAKIEECLSRFQREARISVKLRHPNTVRTFQWRETRGLHYLVMEYLEGETLEEVIKRRGRLPPPEAARVLYQAFLGLQHIHEHGVVHRDLKPSNLMLVPPAPLGHDQTLGTTSKILDVGLGRALFDENDPWGTEDNFQLTTDGAILGDPDYMAPEQAKDAHGADIRADIYGLGATLFHALAGRPVFPDSNRLRQIIRHATEAPPDIRGLNRAVPEGLQAVLNRLLAKDPAPRPGTPAEAALALEPFLPGGDARQTTPATLGVASYLEYVEREPTTKAADGGKGPTAASVHTWGSLFMKSPGENLSSSSYGVEGDNPAMRPSGKIWSAARPEPLPSVKEAAASPKLPPTPPPAPRQTAVTADPKPAAKPASRIPFTVDAQATKQQALKRPKPVSGPEKNPSPRDDGSADSRRKSGAGNAVKSKAERRNVNLDRATGAPSAGQHEAPGGAMDPSCLSRREVRLVILGIVMGGGAIVLACGLGLLLFYALKS